MPNKPTEITHAGLVLLVKLDAAGGSISVRQQRLNPQTVTRLREQGMVELQGDRVQLTGAGHVAAYKTKPQPCRDA